MPYFVWLRLEKQLWKLWLIKGVSLIVVCGYILIWGVKQWVLECFSAELLSCRYKIGFLCFFCLLWMWHLESNVLRFMFICVLFNIGCDAYWLFFLLLFMFLLLLNLLAFKWWWAFFFPSNFALPCLIAPWEALAKALIDERCQADTYLQCIAWFWV